MKIIRKINQTEYILLGIRPEHYLAYPSISGLTHWFEKSQFEAIDKEPEYLKEDENHPNQKVVEIYKRKHDIDFHSELGTGNESLTPLYFQYKRLKTALSSIGMEDSFFSHERAFDDDFYFSMLVGKLESINDIIDAYLQEEETHSRFEWIRTKSDFDLGDKLTQSEFEKGIIELCKFISAKVITNKYSGFIFTDLYALWKTFLLGSDFTAYGKIDIMENHEPQFVCTIKKENIYYHFDYKYLLC